MNSPPLGGERLASPRPPQALAGYALVACKYHQQIDEGRELAGYALVSPLHANSVD